MARGAGHKPNKNSGGGHSTDSRFSIGIHVYSGKARPIRPPKGKNGPVKITKPAIRKVEKEQDD